MKKIKEYFSMRKKYNTLKLKYDVLQEQYEEKTVELNTERRIHKKRKELWEATLKEQEQEIVKLKKKSK